HTKTRMADRVTRISVAPSALPFGKRFGKLAQFHEKGPNRSKSNAPNFVKSRHNGGRQCLGLNFARIGEDARAADLRQARPGLTPSRRLPQKADAAPFYGNIAAYQRRIPQPHNAATKAAAPR